MRITTDRAGQYIVTADYAEMQTLSELLDRGADERVYISNPGKARTSHEIANAVFLCLLKPPEPGSSFDTKSRATNVDVPGDVEGPRGGSAHRI